MIAVARLAIAIVLAGLLPFIFGVLSLFVWPEKSPQLLVWFYLYSAGILAFMAGVYWPIAMQLENRCYPVSPIITMVISQLFFLTAGLALLLPLQLQMAVYPLAYIALYIFDARWMYLYWPRWYRRLRLALTAVALGCQLVVTLWFLLQH